jgi:hypothetical protein
MTEDEYYGIVRRLGLKGTQFREVFMTLRGEPQRVPLAADQTPAQRKETIEWLKTCLGIERREDD